MFLRLARNRNCCLRAVFLLCLILVLPACESSEPSSLRFSAGGAPGEITFWETLIRRFETQSGIAVTLVRQPTDTDQRRQGLVVPLLARQSDPDIFLIDVAWLGQFAASNWLEPLDERVKREQYPLDAFFDSVLGTADRYRGTLVALPVYVDGGLLYYRRDLLDRFGFSGPPETWEELRQMSLLVQKEMRGEDPGFYGYVWQGAQYEGLVCNYLEVAAAAGGGFSSGDGASGLASEPNIRALNFLRDTLHGSRISPPNTFSEMREEETRLYFQSGHALFERNWPYAWTLHESPDSVVRGKIGLAPLPRFEGGQPASALGGWHAGISRFSDRKEEAWQFLKFILSPEIQKELALEIGWNPARKTVYEDLEVLRRLPHLKRLKAVFENAVARPGYPFYTQWSAVVQRHLNAALASEENSRTALLKAELEVSAFVERYGDSG